MRSAAVYAVICCLVLAFFAGCRQNQPPASPQLSGPQTGRAGDTLTYTFFTTDPEGQEVEYMIAWGDTHTAWWSSPYPSGRTATQSHVFGDSGRYWVKVKARDTRLAESGWSDPLAVSVVSSTRLTGTLVLQSGRPGDVQNSRVQLFVTPDLSGTPVYEVSSSLNTPENSPFRFTDLVEGSYYLLGWRDLNDDGVVDDRDIVGVLGGTYRRGYGGSPTDVNVGENTNVGEIAMQVYKELKIVASGVRTTGGTVTNFTYSFNYNVTLTSLAITFPGYSPLTDPAAPGTKTAGTDYRSDGWSAAGGQMPTGAHTLQFIGSWEGGAFDISVALDID